MSSVGVGGPCGGNYYDIADTYGSSHHHTHHHNHHHHHQEQSYSSSSFHNHNSTSSSCYNVLQGIAPEHIFMEETSNSSSNIDHDLNEHDTLSAASSGLAQSPSAACFLLESSSLQGSVSLDTTPEPGTPLPSFQETYSPRYRRDVFSFDESAVSSPYQGQGSGPTTTTTTANVPTPSTSISAPATPHSSGAHHPRRHPFQHQHSLDSQSSSTTASPPTPISYHRQMYYPSQTSPTSYEVLHSPPPPSLPQQQLSSAPSSSRQRKT
jgi:hypothetical protein